MEGFIVTMPEGGAKQEIKIDVLLAQARMYCENQPRQSGLNHDYNMTFLISPRDW